MCLCIVSVSKTESLKCAGKGQVSQKCLGVNLTKTRFQKVLEKCMVLVEFVFGGTMFNFKAFSVQKLSVLLSFWEMSLPPSLPFFSEKTEQWKTYSMSKAEISVVSYTTVCGEFFNKKKLGVTISGGVWYSLGFSGSASREMSQTTCKERVGIWTVNIQRSLKILNP